MASGQVINLSDRRHLTWLETDHGYTYGDWEIRTNYSGYPRLFHHNQFQLSGELERLFNYAYENERRENAKKNSTRSRSS